MFVYTPAATIWHDMGIAMKRGSKKQSCGLNGKHKDVLFLM